MNLPAFLPNIANFLLFSPHDRGDYRPPYEAQSLILRLTENCDNHGQCKFCTYTRRTPGKSQFREKELPQVEKDLQEASQHYARWLSLLGKYENGPCAEGESTGTPHWTQALKEQWYQRVFFQEANALILDASRLKRVMALVQDYFPHIRHFSSFGSAKVLGNPRHPRYKPVEALAELRERGLDRVYMGLESGADEVLGFMGKGSTAQEMTEAGQNVVRAGIELCLSFILGLGGKERSAIHAQETARVLNQIQPQVVAALGLFLNPHTPLYEEMRQGRFTPASLEQILEEKESILERLDFACFFSCSHVANLLTEVTGTLPQDRPKMLAAIHRYRALSLPERLLFILGSRDHWYPTLDHFLQEDPKARYTRLAVNLRVKLNQREREARAEQDSTGGREEDRDYVQSGRRLLERLQEPHWSSQERLLMLRLWERNRSWLDDADVLSSRWLSALYSQASTLFPPQYM